MELKFEWDPKKAASNAKKHGVTFEEAKTLFEDPLARIFDDERNSQKEIRELIIGYSNKNRLLIVSFLEKAEDIIRIISSRPVTKKERKNYEKNRSH